MLGKTAVDWRSKRCPASRHAHEKNPDCSCGIVCVLVHRASRIPTRKRLVKPAGGLPPPRLLVVAQWQRHPGIHHPRPRGDEGQRLRRRADLRCRRLQLRTATTAPPTGRPSSRPNGASSTSTPCARPTGSGLEMSLNIQSGWNLGGPMVKPEDAPKKLVWTETRVTGGKSFTGKLEPPKGRDGFLPRPVRARVSRQSHGPATPSPRSLPVLPRQDTMPRPLATAISTPSGFPAAPRRGRDPPRQAAMAATWLQGTVFRRGTVARAAQHLRPARLRAPGKRRRQNVSHREGLYCRGKWRDNALFPPVSARLSAS